MLCQSITLKLPLGKGLEALQGEGDQGCEGNRRHLESSGKGIFTNPCGSILPVLLHLILALLPSIQSSIVPLHPPPTQLIHPFIQYSIYLFNKQEFLLWHNGIDSVSAAAGTQVQFLAWCSGLRIQHCSGRGIGLNSGLDLIPGPGTPYAMGQLKERTTTAATTTTKANTP